MIGHFESFTDFLAMGNHGLYVWLAYGIFAGVISFIILSVRSRSKTFIKQQLQKIRREQA